METSELYLSSLVLTAGTQVRATIHEPTVRQYAELLEEGIELPAIRVVVVNESDDGEEKYDQIVVVDGFHRVEAARSAGHKTIVAIATDGTMEEAKWLALTANARHGRRLSLEDMDRAIELVLDHPKAKDMTNAEIAMHLGVSERTLNRGKQRLGLSRSYEKHFEGTLDAETQAALKVIETQFPDEAEAIRKGELKKSPEQLQQFAALPKEHRAVLAPMFLDKNLSVEASKDMANLRPVAESIAIGQYLRYAKENPEDAVWLFDGARARVDIIWSEQS